jgi:hypothetical protein
MYKNEHSLCECWKCELESTCDYANKLQRFPKEQPSGLGLCQKLKENIKPVEPVIKRSTMPELRLMFGKWMEDSDSVPAECWIVEDDESCRVCAVDNRNGEWMNNWFQDEYSAVMWLLGKDPDEYFDYTGLVEEKCA